MTPAEEAEVLSRALRSEIIKTMLAARSGAYPESHSDMDAAVRALLRMFEVTRRPLVMP